MLFDLMDEVLAHTNNFASKIIVSKPNALTNWKEVIMEDLWVYIALKMFIGIIRKTSIIMDYWKNDDLLSTAGFPLHISRDRFQQILRTLHF